MKFLRLYSTDPYYNLAVEEYLFRNSDTDVFIIWRNGPAVIIGKNQNAFAEVNLDFAKQNGITVARRITGGGAVYHDLGNVNYSYISVNRRDKNIDFAPFVKPVVEFIAQLGGECTLSGRNDLELYGKKISGNAQYSINGRTLHHGTLLYDTNLSVIGTVLGLDSKKYEHRAVKSHRGRVGNIRELLLLDFSVDSFIKNLEDFVLSSMKPETSIFIDEEKVNELMQRNASYEWIYSSKRFLTDYTVKKTKKFTCGVVTAEIKFSGEVIDNLIISGDFFEIKPVSELEKKFVGLNINTLGHFATEEYIQNLTDDELISLIKQ